MTDRVWKFRQKAQAVIVLFKKIYVTDKNLFLLIKTQIKH